MVTDMQDIRNLLNYIDPATCSYEEWTMVGMALKEEGCSAADWENWSAGDTARYHSGECFRKWNSFQGSTKPVTGGTIFQMAVDRGYKPDRGYELDWDSPIDQDGVVVDKNWLEDQAVQEPRKWDPARQLITYLETLFEPGEAVGFVTKSWKTEKGKYIPSDKGVYKKTAGELIQELSKCGKDIGSVIGDYDPEGGAWIRFNPLDGKGVRNDNVSELRYALVESDDMELGQQNAILRKMELPIAVLVYSGSKSLHAIVRIDAADYTEYRKRVDYLYKICEKNGMTIDTQNRNPSRLSRMPGCVRGEKKQFIVDTNIGKASWNEWYDWIESVNDNLPDVESLEAEWNDMPDLAPALIDGILRKGHKMLISGPSKAGKSFALIELCIAIAEGRKWLHWQCTKGKVLYVNLELDRASCLHRFRDVYTVLHIPPQSLQNIDLWNLRGKSIPMDKLAPKLIRRALKRNYDAIIIDPIYKIITGDENSADQMAKFCNQFDLVCTELNSAVIYCHHHSKGSQGQKKAIDRASGSGVFARDPDAVLDLIELETTPELMLQQENKGICRLCDEFMTQNKAYTKDISDDDKLSSSKLIAYCENVLCSDKAKSWRWDALKALIEEERQTIKSMTAWRIEGTLREFAKFEPVNVWFRYPVHYLDASGSLLDIEPDSIEYRMRKMQTLRKETAKEKREEQKLGFDLAFEGLEIEGIVKINEIAEDIGISEKTICSWFGNGRKARSNYKKDYEIFSENETGERYLKRRNNPIEGGAPDLAPDLN